MAKELSDIKADPLDKSMLNKFRERALWVATGNATSNGDFHRFVELLHQALLLDEQSSFNFVSSTADTLNKLCWRGSIKGYAKEVLFACEKAVATAPESSAVRDSRGLAPLPATMRERSMISSFF